MKRLVLLLPLLLLACATVQPRASTLPEVDEGGGGPGPRGISLLSLVEGQAMAPVGSPSWLGQAYSLTLNAPSGANGITLNSGAAITFTSSGTARTLKWTGTQFQFVGGLSTTGSMSATDYSATVASGANAYGVTTNGARIDFGAGASDYASSDGTTVTFAGPVASTNLILSSGVLAPTVTVSYSAISGQTCQASREGQIRADALSGQSGTSSRTRVCVCTSDGAASPAYAWMNLTSGTVGTTTTCP